MSADIDRDGFLSLRGIAISRPLDDSCEIPSTGQPRLSDAAFRKEIGLSEKRIERRFGQVAIESGPGSPGLPVNRCCQAKRKRNSNSTHRPASCPLIERHTTCKLASAGKAHGIERKTEHRSDKACRSPVVKNSKNARGTMGKLSPSSDSFAGGRQTATAASAMTKAWQIPSRKCPRKLVVPVVSAD